MFLRLIFQHHNLTQWISCSIHDVSRFDCRDYIRNRTDIRPKFGSYYEDVERLLRDGFRTEAFDMLRGTDLISRNLLQINIHFDHRKVTVSTDTVTLSTAGDPHSDHVSLTTADTCTLTTQSP